MPSSLIQQGPDQRAAGGQGVCPPERLQCVRGGPVDLGVEGGQFDKELPRPGHHLVQPDPLLHQDEGGQGPGVLRHECGDDQG